jgi:6-phosphogluconate dehydrogenase (decarboxylating)
MQASEHFPGLDLDKIANLWNQGSVVRSWLLGGRFGRKKMDGGGILRDVGSGSGDRAEFDDAIPFAAG